MPLGFAEPLLGGELFLALDSAVATDVHNAHAMPLRHPADQQPAVAVGRILLAAEDRHAGLPGLVEQLLDRLAEVGGFGHSAVEHVPGGVVAGRIVDAPSQPIAEKAIFDIPITQRRPDRFSIELRGVTRIGTRADVGQHLDPMLRQQVEKHLERVIGVPDRPEHACRVG